MMDWSDKADPIDLTPFIPELARREKLANARTSYNLLLLFGCEGTHKQYVRMKLVEKYGFVRISTMEIVGLVVSDPDHVHSIAFKRYLTEKLPPPPQYIYEQIVNIMKRSKSKNFIIDDLFVCLSYISFMEQHVESIVRIPLVLQFTCSTATCLERMFTPPSIYINMYSRESMADYLENYKENEEWTLDLYRRRNILVTLNCEAHPDVVLFFANFAVDRALVKGEFPGLVVNSQFVQSYYTIVNQAINHSN